MSTLDGNNHQAILDASAWRGDILREQPASWVYKLSATERGELLNALAAVKRTGLAITKVEESNFVLPRLGAIFARLQEEIESGRGFVLLKSLPIEGLDIADASLLYWGVMRHFGTPITQNTKGEYIGHVRDLGLRWGEIRDGERVRGYLTSELLHFHSDNTDLVGLLCMHPARIGGLSSIVSAVTLYNEILREHREHLDQLMEGFHYSLRGEQAPGALPYTEHRVPVFSLCEGKLSCGYVRKGIEQGAEDRGIPLSERERAALVVIEMLAKRDDLRLDMTLEIGDLQLLNNYTNFHSRSEFIDFDEPEKRRHLLRMWLQSKVRRPLSWALANRYGTAAPYRRLQ